MDGTRLLRHGILGFILLVGSTPAAFAWELGGPAYSGYRYDIPPSWFGYNLNDRYPTYYGGGNYREYYNFDRGFGWANFPDMMIYTPVNPLVHPRPLPPRPLPPTFYTPTSYLFSEAHFVVNVPAEAEVWLEGHKTQQTGCERFFVSPCLDPGACYSYTIRARWQEDGRVVEQEQTVPIQAGSQVKVRFPTPTPAEPLPEPNRLPGSE
jgi:uncharacterized protein (TIGR03000 family)